MENYKFSFFWVGEDLQETSANVYCNYEDIPWKMCQLANMFWGDRWEEVNQANCLVPLYVRNIDTREALIAK